MLLSSSRSLSTSLIAPTIRPMAAGVRKWIGPFMWTLGGLLISLTVITMASVGLVLLPIVLPIAVFVFLLVEYRVSGRIAAAVGVLLGIDVFALSLVIDPPCRVPVLERLPDSTFQTGCAESDNMFPLFGASLVGTLLICALLYARGRGRRAGADPSVGD